MFPIIEKMTIGQFHYILSDKRRWNIFLAASALLLCFITVVSDLFFSYWQDTRFFLSESLLFSSFWLLFLPILNIQLKLIPSASSIWVRVLFTVAATGSHLFAYPALVWLLSQCFYDHTFSYWQTFNFGLTEHIIKAVIIYSIPYTSGFFYKNRLVQEADIAENVEVTTPASCTSILVSDANNKKVSIAINDILYFSANPPYVNIHHPAKKYLHSETLKSLEANLPAQTFVRIHKSFIVNIRYVVSYQSRLNGDYDLSLVDGTVLRVSRNYAATFKKSLDERHQVNAK